MSSLTVFGCVSVWVCFCVGVFLCGCASVRACMFINTACEVLKAYGYKKVEVDLNNKFGQTFATSLKLEEAGQRGPHSGKLFTSVLSLSKIDTHCWT